MSWLLWHILERNPQRVRTCAVSILVLGGGTLIASAPYVFLGLSLEESGFHFWAGVSLASFVSGYIVAKRTGTMALIEFSFSFVFVLQAGICLLLCFDADFSLASATIRMLLVIPALVGLWGYFGMSLGFLFVAEGSRQLSIGYELLIGRRFLLAKSSPVLSAVTSISVVGVALGVWLVIVSLAILGGFESDLRRKIIGVNAHIQIEAARGDGFALDKENEEIKNAGTPFIATSPYLEGEVAFAGNANYVGGILFGVNPIEASQVLNVFDELASGSVEALLQRPPAEDLEQVRDAESEFAAPAPIPGIVLGTEMAKSLNVLVGDRVNIISPTLEVLTPFGPAPRILGFEVVGIFSTKMYEYDARFAYTNLTAARQFFQVEDTHVTGLHGKLSDPNAVPRAKKLVQSTLGPKFTSRGWMERNRTLFSALKLERVVAFVVLAFIILVASFSIVNTLTMSIIEKQKEIAILMTMGARSIGIMKLFLVQGLLIGGFGALIGGAGGAATAIALKRFGVWIPDDVYYIDALPVHLEATDVIVVVLAALLIVWDFAVFPALRGSQLKPVEGLREG